MASELTVIWMGQTSKPVDTLIIPIIYIYNQPGPNKIGSDNIWGLTDNVMENNLGSDQFFAKAWPFFPQW